MAQAKATTMTESFVDRIRRIGDDALDAGARAFHAGVGLLATTGEAARDTFERMVDKGREYESDESRLFSRATREARELGQQVEQRVERVVAATLHRTGVPTRDEIQQLGRRVETLTRKVEELARK